LRWLLGLSLAVLGSHIEGQTEAPPLPSPSELKKLSLETLLDIEVTSVSKKEEKLSQTASAIQVITGDEIRRSGATSIPEALRLATNLQVAQVDSRQWAITARGFNGTTANKLLVLIDGRSVYTPLFSGVFWDVQDTLLEDVERIEVISGPGGTLWGANAVNGVINIITKEPASTQGLLISLGAGTDVTTFDGIRYGGKLASADYRVYGKYFDRDSSVRNDGSDAGDMWKMKQGGFRVDVRTRLDDAFTIQGDLYSGSADEPGAGDVDLHGSNLIGRWTKTISDTASLQLQFYYDNTHREIPNTFEESLDTYDVDFQHRFAAGRRHGILWGLNYRASDDNVVNSPLLSFLPAKLTTELFSGFIQDEIELFDDRLNLTLGTKLEHNDFSGFEYQPSVRVAVHLSDDRTVWAAVSRAVRTPSRIDRDFYVPSLDLEGGPGFDSEKLIAYELGIRGRSHGAFSFSASTFFHDYDDLRSLENTTPRLLANGLAGEAYGVEVTASDSVTSTWRLTAGYTFLRLDLQNKPGSTDVGSKAQVGDSPEHQVLLRSLLDVSERLQWDATARYVASLPNQDLSSYWELDMRLGYFVREGLEFSLIGRNLLHDQHAEFGRPATRRALQRSIAGRITWSF
jgi:iron complex outermembrane receptor protein